MDFFAAALPVVLLVYWMTRTESLPSNRALPLAALVLYVLLLAWFRSPPLLVHAAVVEGLLTAATPVMIVWGAILLFRTMEHSGAMGVVRQWLNGITVNPVAQLMIVGWSFSFLVEGISGFGTPAALAAPLLAGMGFPARKAAVLCLMMNTVPVSFGAVGMPIWFGLGELGLTPEELRITGFKTAVIHSAGAFFIPFAALAVILPWSGIRANAAYVLLVIVATVSVFLTASWWSVEFPAIAGGLSGLAASILLARRGTGLAEVPQTTKAKAVASTAVLKATFPLWGTVFILLITRIGPLGVKDWLTSTAPALQVPLPGMGNLSLSASLVIQWQGILGTPLNWSHAVLYVPSVLPFFLVSGLTFLLYRTPRPDIRRAWSASLSQVLKPMGAFLGALVLVKLLMVGGPGSCAAILGRGMAAAGGGVWQFAAVYLGALGSFFSGSNTVSNLTFGSIQNATAVSLGLPRTTILSLQSAGGAMGNMICIHNIVAVCSILGLANEEGRILRQTIRPVLIYGAIAGVVSLFL